MLINASKKSNMRELRGRRLSQGAGLLILFLFLASFSVCHDVRLTSLQRVLGSTDEMDDAPLVDFQVNQPMVTPKSQSDRSGCVHTTLLMDHAFAFSYGDPFVGDYSPPPCDFNQVTMNLTVSSRGRQFDRLGLMYLGDVEVFRTSTAEPTRNGILWTYIKNVEQYNVLWKQKQRMIFDLGNLINDVYTGTFNVTLTATFFTVPGARDTADVILPISSKQSSTGKGSTFTVPGQNASVSYQIPPNIKRAVISLSACGQSAEEFWYTNVPSSHENTFASTTGALSGYSPFREVQLLIDGHLIGVSWPFPIIFTGGIAPALWRPIVGIDAFDLREHEIDITPWLPLLCRGRVHSFEIRVVGLHDDGAGNAELSDRVGSYWVVTGKIFLFLDQPGLTTTGSIHAADPSPPHVRISSVVTTNPTGANQTLTCITSVKRTISTSATIITSTGPRLVSWTQQLSYHSFNYLSHQGLVQFTSQTTHGSDLAPHGSTHHYSYPLTLDTSIAIIPPHNIRVDASLSRSLNLTTTGNPAISPLCNARSTSTPPPSHCTLATTQSGSASFLSAGKRHSYSYGTTAQSFSTTDPFGMYARHVRAVNATVVEDHETVTDSRPGAHHAEHIRHLFAAERPAAGPTAEFTSRSVWEALGRRLRLAGGGGAEEVKRGEAWAR